jgi:hypothetical protein
LKIFGTSVRKRKENVRVGDPFADPDPDPATKLLKPSLIFVYLYIITVLCSKKVFFSREIDQQNGKSTFYERICIVVSTKIV